MPASAAGKFEDQYTIIGKKVGSGSFAEVSFGTHNGNGAKVAVKVIKKRRLFTPEERESVKREVRLLSCICDERVCVVLACGGDSGFAVLVARLWHDADAVEQV